MSEAESNLMESRGKYFEEFAVGKRICTTARTITESDIVAFAGLTGDWNQMHTDAEYASKTMFGERVAHGLLILSIASGLAWQLGFMSGTVDAFLGLEWKFRAPVKIGDTVHMEAEVSHIRAVSRMGGGMVTMDISVLNQRQEVVQKGVWEVLVKSKGNL
jgi:3-hydroxybutyryl-CoA dehydratase